MVKFKVREYKSGDSKKIYELFTEFTPYIRDEKFWVWINRMLSDEKSLIVVAESGDKIVGHYAVIPQEFLIQNESYKIGFAIHAFIHPDFRSTFMIFQITKRMYKIAKEQAIEAIYGFPNANFRDIQVKADKWKQVSLFKALEKTSLKKSENRFNLKKIEKNHSDYYILSEVLDSQSVNQDCLKLRKNLNYYINRYIHHPQDLYESFFIENNGEYLAFIVLKTYQDYDQKIGHLVDYVATEQVTFEEVLIEVENYFTDKVSKLSFWKFGESQKEILLKKGFKENGFETFLGIKMLSNNHKLEEKLLNFDNWELCMGDSDAF